MSLPPIGTPIVVTTTSKKGEVGKFFGTYEPRNGEFVLRPLPGKYNISQLPMYKNQEHGWEYAYPPEKGKQAVDPQQELVDVEGLDRMEFPGGMNRNDPFSWTLLEDDPSMRVHDNLPVDVRTEIAKILQSDGDRRVQLGKLATKYPKYKDNIIKVARSEKKLLDILGSKLSAYGKVNELKQLHLIVPHFKEHIERAISVLEPIVAITQSDLDSHSKIKKLSSMANPTTMPIIKEEVNKLKRDPPPAIQKEIYDIVLRGRHADANIRRLMLFHLANVDGDHRLFSPGIMKELTSSKIVESLGEQAKEIATIFDSTDLETVIHRLRSVADKYPQHKASIHALIHASILDEIDYLDRKSPDDASTKMKKLGTLANILQKFPEYTDDHRSLIHKHVKEQSQRVHKAPVTQNVSSPLSFGPPPKLTRSTNIGGKRRKSRRKRR